jgi:large subunit ribosomal protein L25
MQLRISKGNGIEPWSQGFIYLWRYTMSDLFELSVERRVEIGKGASRRLRRLENKVPGILYGGEDKPVSIMMLHKDLAKALENTAFYSHILTIKFEGTEQKAILRDLHRHPYKPRILHFDLFRVSAKEKIQMQVPLNFVGEESAPGVKLGGGIVSRIMASLELRCLPRDLPESIEVDISGLELDKSIHLSEVKLPKGVEFATPIQAGTERDLPVVSIHLPRSAIAAEEETGAPVAPDAPEAIKQTAAEDKDKDKG